MKKHDKIFIVLAAAAVASVAWVITENSTTTCRRTAATTASVRQSFIDMKLPLHEGKYWRVADE